MSYIIKIASILICCMVIAAHAAEPKSASYAAITFTVDQGRADLALMRTALEEAHPGLYRYLSKSEIDAAFARFEKRVKTSITDVELHGEISLLLATIRCDHIKAEFSGAMTKFRNESPTHLPFRFKLLTSACLCLEEMPDPRCYVVRKLKPILRPPL